MNTVTLTKRDRRDMQRMELKGMQTLSMDTVEQLAGYMLDCLTHPTIYGKTEIQDEDALRAALIDVFKIISPCLTDKAASGVYDLYLILKRHEVQRENKVK